MDVAHIVAVDYEYQVAEIMSSMESQDGVTNLVKW
jgi:hypothetical protein